VAYISHTSSNEFYLKLSVPWAGARAHTHTRLCSLVKKFLSHVSAQMLACMCVQYTLGLNHLLHTLRSIVTYIEHLVHSSTAHEHTNTGTLLCSHNTLVPG